jgi:hypothetical protein
VAIRVPIPGRSYLREETVRVHAGPGDPGRSVVLGMTPPSSTDDGWWLAVLWAADAGEVVTLRDIAPKAGPPPGPPLLTIGPLFTGALSGLVAEENGRQAVRLRLPAAESDSSPWDRPLILQVALKWDPVRATTMTGNQLAREAQRAFGRAIVATGRPG